MELIEMNDNLRLKCNVAIASGIKIVDYEDGMTEYAVNKLDKILTKRLARVGLAEVCGRCGGSGKHSYNSRHGSTCYGCAGSKYKLPEITPELLQVVKEKSSLGEFNQ